MQSTTFQGWFYLGTKILMAQNDRKNSLKKGILAILRKMLFLEYMFLALFVDSLSTDPICIRRWTSCFPARRGCETYDEGSGIAIEVVPPCHRNSEHLR